MTCSRPLRRRRGVGSSLSWFRSRFDPRVSTSRTSRFADDLADHFFDDFDRLDDFDVLGFRVREFQTRPLFRRFVRRQLPDIDIEMLEDPPDMLVAGKQQAADALRWQSHAAPSRQLRRGRCQSSRARRPAPTATLAAFRVPRCQRQTQTQEQLLARSAAQLLDRHRAAIVIVDAQPAFAERRPDALVLAARELAQVIRRFAAAFPAGDSVRIRASDCRATRASPCRSATWPPHRPAFARRCSIPNASTQKRRSSIASLACCCSAARFSNN